jgi:hypothetical protein
MKPIRRTRSKSGKVTKTATVSLHGNSYEVEAILVGCRVELVFSPFDLDTIEVHYRGAHYGRAVPFRITRHTHPKARPETPEPAAAPATGIAYLQLVAEAHQQQLHEEERIGFHALYSTAPPNPAPDNSPGEDAQLPGQPSIHDALTVDHGDGIDGPSDAAAVSS